MAIPPPQISGLSEWRALARGGFATVWEARQESLNRLVAVKVDQRRLDTDSERRRFLREAGAAGRMSGHPGIVTVHDAGILGDNRPYLVMELCPGGSLTPWLTADPRPTEPQVREVGVHISDALAAAHARGVLHRDVKPANILIDAYGHAGLADFGLAALPDPGLELSATLEAITPAWAPPEVFEQQPPTEFGDVYSLAATMYALLSGRAPHQVLGRPTEIADAMARLAEPIVAIAGVSPDFMALLTAALATDPSDRPSAAQFRDRLAALDLDPSVPVVDEPDGTGAEVPAGLAATNVRAGPPPRRRRRWAWVPIALVAAALLVVLTLWVVNRPSTGIANAPASSLGGGPATESSVTTGPSSATEPSGSPTPTTPVVPAGFEDCSGALGDGAYCRTTAECWNSIMVLVDTPAIATPRSCRRTHVYQTFAGGRLDAEIRRQSQLEADPLVRRTCTADVLNAMLARDDRRTDWEIIAIPPQDDENYFRCIFGHGDHRGPYDLQT